MTSPGLFNPIVPLWLCLLLIGIAGAWSIYLEVRRSQRRLPVRILAAVIMLTGLSGIILRPQAQREHNTTIIITPGAMQSVTDSLKRTYRNSAILRIDTVNNADAIRGLPAIHDRLFISGDGIPMHSIDYLEGIQYTYLAGTAPRGVVELKIPDSGKLNRVNLIEGVYNNTSDSVWLKLESPSGVVDSIFIEPSSKKEFSLSFIPRQAGKFIYKLNECDHNGNILASNDLPVVVEKFKPLQILFLTGFPSAEIRFLKNALAADGHKLTLRHRVSANRYRTEEVNNAPTLAKFSNESLQLFDLVICDQQTATNFSSGEKSTLSSAVNEGLGMLVLLDEVPEKSLTGFFTPTRFTPTKNDSATVTLSGTTVRLPTTGLQAEDFSAAILRDKTGNAVQGLAYHGLGKVGFQLLKDTYTLALAGESQLYADAWTPLLEKLSRKDNSASAFNLKTAFPIYPRDPVQFEIITGDNNTPSVKYQHTRIPLLESVYVDDVWSGKLWFSENGWHQLSLMDSSSVEIFVTKQGQWSALRTTNQINAHRQHERRGEKNQELLTVDTEPVSPLLFYFLFLAGFGFLWLAPKL